MFYSSLIVDKVPILDPSQNPFSRLALRDLDLHLFLNGHYQIMQAFIKNEFLRAEYMPKIKIYDVSKRSNAFEHWHYYNAEVSDLPSYLESDTENIPEHFVEEIHFEIIELSSFCSEDVECSRAVLVVQSHSVILHSDLISIKSEQTKDLQYLEPYFDHQDGPNLDFDEPLIYYYRSRFEFEEYMVDQTRPRYFYTAELGFDPDLDEFVGVYNPIYKPKVEYGFNQNSQLDPIWKLTLYNEFHELEDKVTVLPWLKVIKDNSLNIYLDCPIGNKFNVNYMLKYRKQFINYLEIEDLYDFPFNYYNKIALNCSTSWHQYELHLIEPMVFNILRPNGEQFNLFLYAPSSFNNRSSFIKALSLYNGDLLEVRDYQYQTLHPALILPFEKRSGIKTLYTYSVQNMPLNLGIYQRKRERIFAIFWMAMMLDWGYDLPLMILE